MAKLTRKESVTTLHGIEGRGANLNAAKINARENLAAAVRRLHYGPITARVSGPLGEAVTMAIPDGTGWRYLTLIQPGKPMPTGDLSLKCFSFGNDEDPGNIRAQLTRHAAQLVWSHDCADDTGWSLNAGAQCGTLGATVSQDLRRWCAFQRAYARATAEGKTQHEAHVYACAESTYERIC